MYFTIYWAPSVYYSIKNVDILGATLKTYNYSGVPNKWGCPSNRPYVENF